MGHVVFSSHSFEIQRKKLLFFSHRGTLTDYQSGVKQHRLRLVPFCLVFSARRERKRREKNGSETETTRSLETIGTI